MTRLVDLAPYTPDDIEDAARDLAQLLADHEAETDPHWREVLSGWIADDARWLAEMLDVVQPPLPLVMPIGLPAPRPGEVWK